jgi:hypothetical protein
MSDPTYFVVSILEPHGDTIDRRDWHLHVTVLPEFRAIVAEVVLAQRMADVASAFPAFEISGAGDAWFGPNGDVHVRVVDSDELRQLHRALMDAFSDVIVPLLPQYCGDGFGGHVSDQIHRSMAEGERLPVSSVSLVRLVGDEARVLETVALG